VPATLDYSRLVPRLRRLRALIAIASLALALVILVGCWLIDSLAPARAATLSTVAAIVILGLCSPLLAIAGTLITTLAYIHDESPRLVGTAFVLVVVYALALVTIILASTQVR
jgi:hypothetical protein